MKTYHDFHDLPSGLETAVTVGSFDGLHLGHQHLLGRTLELASGQGLAPWVLTFEPHPARALAPDLSPPLLLGLERKLRALASAGFSVLAQSFDQDFARLEPAEFVEQVLGALGARAVVVGDDFTFGRGRAGKADELRVLVEKILGGRVEVCDKLAVDGMIASSTRIRAFLLQGRVEAAQTLLGRPYVVAGRVERGQGRGRGLGIPTANLCSPAELLPARGVYVCWAHLPGRGRARLAVTNIGHNPTFGQGPRTIESHLLDFDEDLLGQALALSFCARLRDERRFDGPDALVAQIRQDMDQAERWAEGRQAPEKPGELDGIILDRVRCG